MNVYKKLQQSFLADALLVVVGLGVHLYYLFHTTFVDWPELILYPWLQNHGLLYYRDIVIPFPPAINWLLSLMYVPLGFSVTSERIISYVLIIATDIILYWLVKKQTGSWFAALGSLVFFIFWQPILYGNTLWHETVLTPLFVVSYLYVVQYLEMRSIKRAILLGLFFALLTLSKQTAVWPMLVVCTFVWLTAKYKRTGLWHAVVIGGIAISAHALVWRYYALLGAGDEYGFWVFRFPLLLSDTESLYKLSISRSDVAYVAPAFLPVLLLPFYPGKKQRRALLLFWIVALIAMAFPRWAIHRLQPALAFAAIGFGVFITRLRKVRLNILSFLGIVVLAGILVGSYRSFRIFLIKRDPMQPQFFDAMYQKLKMFGATHLDKPFFILGNYDYLYIGLDATPAVLPWIQMLPWNARLPGVQQRIVSELEIQKIPYILYIPYHPKDGYYLDYMPELLLLYMEEKYEKIRPLPIGGGWLYQRK